MMAVDRNLVVMERVMMALQKHYLCIHILPHTLLMGWRWILSKNCDTMQSDTSPIWWSAETRWRQSYEVICVITQLAVSTPSHHKTVENKLSFAKWKLMFSPLSQCIWRCHILERNTVIWLLAAKQIPSFVNLVYLNSFSKVVSVRWDCNCHRWCGTHPTRAPLHRVYSDVSVVTLEIAFSDHSM